jgi:histidinol-phosphate aminotransferase
VTAEQKPVRLRPEIVALAAYRQGKPAADDAFKLSSNENPYEPIPEVLEAISASSVNRYPDAAAIELRTMLSQRFGVGLGSVHLGAGSVSVLSQLIQAAAGPGDEVLYSWRSFEAYPGLVAVSGAASVQVPNAPDAGHDLAAMLAAITDRTRVVIVCSPNNPTGTIVSETAFLEFIAAVPETALVILDEAYIEFVTEPGAVDGSRLIGRFPNLVILRTFSKAYGLAGLRIGYAVGPEYVLDAARSTSIPLSVTEPAQLAAIASLKHEAVLLERVSRLSLLRDRIWAALTGLGWSVPQPHGNFVWLPTGGETERAAEVFASHGIVTRPFHPEGIRVSIGEEQAVDALLAAAEELAPRAISGPETA